MSVQKTRRPQPRRASHSKAPILGNPPRKDRTIGTSLKDKKKYTFSGYKQIPFHLIIVGILAVGIVIFAITRMPSCSSLSSQVDSNNSSKVSVIDKIEPGTPASLEEKLTPVLERNEKLSWIAANTSKYSDPRIVELALREPEAVDFVYNYPTNPPAVQAYGKGVQKGTAPVFYCWNNSWGAANYGGLPLAVTGSAPTVLSMAYMGTLGKTDMSPADMAELSKKGGYVSEKGITVSDFFLDSAEKVGLSCKVADKTEQTVSLALSKRNFLIAHVESTSKTTDDSHWILIADHAQSGALIIHDPTSVANTKQLWDGADLLSKVDELYIVSDNNPESQDQQ